MGSRNRLRRAVLEAELPDPEQGLDTRLVWLRIGGPIDLQALAFDVDAVGDPDVKLGQFEPALEARRESLDDPGAENRLSVNNRDPDANCG